jgi:16S rRNA (guanine527-N7)-methyltransferase
MIVERGRAPLDPAGFASIMGVSRETTAKLESYLDLLRLWQGAINLVGRSTLQDPWRRHILDCAQLIRFLPEPAEPLIDCGSGAGLPGIILAIMGASDVHLVEADRRKAQFLREAARRLELAGVTVHAERLEHLPLQGRVVTARALAPLRHLLPLTAPLVVPGGRLVLLKGRTAVSELMALADEWTMTSRVEPSLADAEGRVLVLEGVMKRAR